MNIKKIIFIVCLLISVFTCTTKEGILSFSAPGNGKILVVSDVSNSARIFIDQLDTEQKTPATINNVSEGRHKVQLLLEGYRISPPFITVEVKEKETTRIDGFSFVLTPSVGNLTVNSSPDNALVFVDDLPLGLTPLTVRGLLAASHKVKIVKGGYQPVEKASVIIPTGKTVTLQSTLKKQAVVLIEEFSSIHCDPCVNADIMIERQLHDKGVNLIAPLVYHSSSMGSDLFFEAASGANKNRYQYYKSPRALPHIVVNGAQKIVGYDEAAFLAALKLSLQSVKPPVAILGMEELMRIYQARPLTGGIRVEALDNFSANLYIALIERDIIFSKAPGKNGQKHFHNIIRALYPATGGGYGHPISLSKGEVRLVKFEFKPKPMWQGKMDVVAFLQKNDATQEILQTVWSAQYR